MNESGVFRLTRDGFRRLARASKQLMQRLAPPPMIPPLILTLAPPRFGEKVAQVFYLSHTCFRFILRGSL
jgi:hypothetical protein